MLLTAAFRVSLQKIGQKVWVRLGNCVGNDERDTNSSRDGELSGPCRGYTETQPHESTGPGERSHGLQCCAWEVSWGCQQ